VTTPAKAVDCRCGGTGAFTAEIPGQDALVPVRQICVAHIAPRALVRERSAPDRVGEVMAIRKLSNGFNVYLRPPGGGLEWTADPKALEPVEESA
jgi:hypothetical protein